MKKMCVLVLVLLISIGSAFAKQGNMALGVMVGEPTGLSGKMGLGKNAVIDGGLAWSFGNNGALHVHSDYLMYNYKLINSPDLKLPVYYGIGARIRLEDNSRIGIRVPVGVDYKFNDHPLDLFFELVPVLELVPSTSFDVSGGLGLRYNF